MRASVLLTILSFSSSMLLAAACGGGAKPAEGPTPAAPGDPSATTPETAPTTTTTTSLTLSDAGDLQGAKLTQTTTTTSAEAAKPAASAEGGKKSEPGRSPEDIRAIITARRGEIRTCYDKALKDHPGIGGDLVIKWKIDPKGAVGDIAVDQSKSNLTEASTAKCIMDIIKQIKFAESAKGFETRANYPFNFNPASGGKTGAPDAGK